MLVLFQRAAATSGPLLLPLHLMPPPLHSMPPLSPRICHLRPGHRDEEENDEPPIHKNMLQHCHTLQHDDWRQYTGNIYADSEYSHVSAPPATGKTLDSPGDNGNHHTLRMSPPPHLTMALPTWSALDRKQHPTTFDVTNFDANNCSIDAETTTDADNLHQMTRVAHKCP